MPQAFVAIGEYVVYLAATWGASTATAVAIGSFVTTALTYGTYYFLLNKAAGLFLDKGSGRRVNSGLEVAITDTAAEGLAIYGLVRCNGINKIPPITGGQDGKYLEQVIELAMHDCTYIPLVMADDQLIPDQIISAFGGTFDDGKLTDSKFLNKMTIRRYYSMTQFAPTIPSRTVDYTLNNRYPTVFTSDFIGADRTWVGISYEWDDKVYSGGVPNMTFWVNGKKCYDPRKDATQSGGAGAHRVDDSTTWEFTCNPALHWADFAMASFGGNVPSSKINWPSVMAAANICDASVLIPAVFTAYATDGTATLVGNTITKASGADGWDASVRSTDDATPEEKPYCSAQMTAGTGGMCIGLTTDPTANASFNSIDYAWFVDVIASNIQISENGVSKATFSYRANAVLEVVCDGSWVYYYIDGELGRAVPLASTTATLYFDSSLYRAGDTATIMCKRRYTSNVRIGLARDWRDNAKLFIDAMVGRMIRRDGVWFIYAGAYDAPTFTIEKKDWLQIESIKTVAPRDSGRWNTARVWYTDRARNWQREECFPRRNAAFKADDNNEEIPLEMEQPACTDEFEAQRKGEFLLRQSRNQIALVGVLPPRFHFVATGEMGALTFDDFGWQSKIMRVRAMDLLSEGQVRVALAEEQATDWEDLDPSDYNAPSDAVIPTTNPTQPSAPASFAMENNLNGTLAFIIGQPIVYTKDTYYQVIRSTVSTNAAVGTIVWEGRTQRGTITSPASVHYYFARAIANSYISAYTPNTTGISAVPLGWTTQQINSNAATDVVFANNGGGASSNSTVVGPILTGAWTKPGVPCKAMVIASALLRRSTFNGLSRVYANIGADTSGLYNVIPTSDQLYTLQVEVNVNSSTDTTSFGMSFDCGTYGNIAWSNVRAKLEVIKL